MFDLTFLAIIAPFLAAIAAPILVRLLGQMAPWILAIVPALIFLHFATYLPEISQLVPAWGYWELIPNIGISLSYYIDGLSLTFALLISGIGALIVIYAGGYLKNHPHLGRFLSFLFLFMGAMQGLIISDNLVTLFIFWELTSVTSFLLIGFDHTKTKSRRAALQALVVTGGGGLALLAGIILIDVLLGTTDLSRLLSQPSLVQSSSFHIPILILFLIGAFTKSAQFPFHFWLPNAMEAPTPVSAYLHSATMVKAGIYLLMRMHPILGNTLIWSIILPLFGGMTLLAGTILAVRQTDMKLMLAYTTMASLGLLVLLIGTSNEIAITGAVIYLVAHSLFKGTLFMVAGAVDHEAGTRQVTKLGGLRSQMPITFAAAFLAALSMAGLPPFLGFIAKEELYRGLYFLDLQSILLTTVVLIGNALMLVIGFAVALKPFIGARPNEFEKVHEAPFSMWLGPLLLAVLGALSVIMLGTSEQYIIAPMAAAIMSQPIKMSLHLIPTGIHANLILSLATIVLGFLLYQRLELLRKTVNKCVMWIGWGPDKGFDQFMIGLVKFSFAISERLQNGRLATYVKIVFLVAAVALMLPLFALNELPTWPDFPPIRFYEGGVMLIAILGLIAVLRANNRLTAIVALGIQGFAVALLFLLFGAPDLSFTQFMVETLSVVILALVMTRLSLFETDHRTFEQNIIDGTLAATVGAALFCTLLAVVEQPFNSALSDFFREYSVPVAHGRNIVNVILVDFRGLDTLGEIAVVAIAGLAILALIRIRPKREAHEEAQS